MSADLLFDVPQTLSPRLTWRQRHGVSIALVTGSEDGAWWAWCGGRSAEQVANGSLPHEHFAQADSEDAAITAHALRRGLRLWNEEPLQ